MTGKYHSECVSREKYRTLEAEVSDQRDLIVALERLLVERDATIARLTKERDSWARLAIHHDGQMFQAGLAEGASDRLRAALDAEGQEPPAAETCQGCGGSGYLSTMDGEDLGACDCPAGTPAAPEPVYRTGIQCPTGSHPVGTICTHPYKPADVPPTSDNGTSE
jgi:hypothetical protein